MISAAIQVIFLAIAFKITSCTFIIRSGSAAALSLGFSTPGIPRLSNRTIDALIPPDNSHASDTRRHWPCLFHLTKRHTPFTLCIE
jgi:hypothetical protein